MMEKRSLGWTGAAALAAPLAAVVAVLAAGAAHAVLVRGRGELAARGSGSAVLELRGGVAASGIGLAVAEESKVVETSGEGQMTPLGDGRVLLEGFGQVVVRSPNEPTRVELAGARLRIRARGAGFAWLRGVGQYTTEDGEGRWGATLAIELVEGEPQ